MTWHSFAHFHIAAVPVPLRSSERSRVASYRGALADCAGCATADSNDWSSPCREHRQVLIGVELFSMDSPVVTGDVFVLPPWNAMKGLHNLCLGRATCDSSQIGNAADDTAERWNSLTLQRSIHTVYILHNLHQLEIVSSMELYVAFISNSMIHSINLVIVKKRVKQIFIMQIIYP